MKNLLAVNNGPKSKTTYFPQQYCLGKEEKQAIQRVLDRGILTGYQGNWSNNFWGGPEIQELEKEWCKKFNTEHAIPCNSATSGLHIACGAIGLKPGDEVIVAPYSMTCSATAPMIYGATPVFADIEPDYFCLAPISIEKRITDKTKAIIVVDLFGQIYNSIEINKIAKRHGLYVIEDAAQAIGAYKIEYGPFKDDTVQQTKAYAGTLGDIGVFSFNQGKHITCGEGGMIVTNDNELAMKCRLIMNHAEAVVNDACSNVIQKLVLKNFDYSSLVGFNMRMTEIQAAIIREQLKKLDWIITTRQNNAEYLTENLKEISAITRCKIRKNCTHTYYAQPFSWDNSKADGLHRDIFINAVKAELMPRAGRGAEGVAINNGYIQPIYQMPLFDLPKGLCPTCEKLYENDLFLHLYLAPPTDTNDMNDIIDAFRKVWKHRKELI